MQMAAILKFKMSAIIRMALSIYIIACLESLVSQTWVLPPFTVSHAAPMLRNRLKYCENVGYFEIQDGRPLQHFQICHQRFSYF